jgi:hypothetical protein
VHDSGAPATRQAERSLTRLLATAHRYWRELKKGEINISELAAREQVSAAWVTRVLRLAFLAPDVTAAILDGRQRADMDAGGIVATGAVDPSWGTQRLAYLPRVR